MLHSTNGSRGGKKALNEDLETKTATHMVNPGIDPAANLVMDHIADPLQFLALLTLKLSAGKLTYSDTDAISSSQPPVAIEAMEKEALSTTSLYLLRGRYDPRVR